MKSLEKVTESCLVNHSSQLSDINSMFWSGLLGGDWAKKSVNVLTKETLSRRPRKQISAMTTRGTQIGNKLDSFRLIDKVGVEEEEEEEVLATGNSSWVAPILGPRRFEKTPMERESLLLLGEEKESSFYEVSGKEMV